VGDAEGRVGKHRGALTGGLLSLLGGWHGAQSGLCGEGDAIARRGLQLNLVGLGEGLGQQVCGRGGERGRCCEL